MSVKRQKKLGISVIYQRKQETFILSVDVKFHTLMTDKNVKLQKMKLVILEYLSKEASLN